jgi:hypothetical protein
VDSTVRAASPDSETLISNITPNAKTSAMLYPLAVRSSIEANGATTGPPARRESGKETGSVRLMFSM